MHSPSGSPLLPRLLRWLALAVVLVALLWWWQAGARVGFWQTQVSVTATDPVTGLSVQEWHPKFVPGIETPALGLGGAVAALAASFFLHRRNPNQKSIP